MRHCLYFLLIAPFLSEGQTKTGSTHYKTMPHAESKILEVYVAGSYGKTYTYLTTRFLTDTWTDAYDTRLYLSSGNVSVSLTRERIPPTDVDRAWRRVSATFYDLNVQFNQPFYGFIGLTRQQLTGFYNGIYFVRGFAVGQDFMRTYWGVNMGAGACLRITKHIDLYTECKARILWTEKKLGNSDVYVNIGLGLRLFGIPVKRIFRDPNDKYHWF
jgi:hypothetical protein